MKPVDASDFEPTLYALPQQERNTSAEKEKLASSCGRPAVANATEGGFFNVNVRSTSSNADSRIGGPLLTTQDGDGGLAGGKKRPIALPPVLLPRLLIGSMLEGQGAQSARCPSKLRDGEEAMDQMLATMSARNQAWRSNRRRDAKREERQKRADEAAREMRRAPRRPFCAFV